MPRFLVLFALAVVAFSLSIAGVSGANWNPQLAAQYLDARQTGAWHPD